MKKVLLIIVLLIFVVGACFSTYMLFNEKDTNTKIKNNIQEINKKIDKIKKDNSEYKKEIDKIKEENAGKNEELQIWEKAKEKLKKAQ